MEIDHNPYQLILTSLFISSIILGSIFLALIGPISSSSPPLLDSLYLYPLPTHPKPHLIIPFLVIYYFNHFRFNILQSLGPRHLEPPYPAMEFLKPLLTQTTFQLNFTSLFISLIILGSIFFSLGSTLYS